MRKAFTYALAASMALLLATCGGSPTDPTPTPVSTLGSDTTTLEAGRWSGEDSCMSVEGAACDFIAGCWRGHFARPVVHADGTFSVDGVYRFEGGPISNETPPPAHFTGSVKGSTLTLTIQPPGNAQPISVEMKLSGSGTCPLLCV